MKTRIFLFLTLGALLAGCRNNATAPKRVRLNVEMSVSAGNRAALLENLLLLAEASRAEPGCIGYEIYENSRDSSRILIFETWRDAASLEAHQQTEHFRLRAPRNRELSETSVLSRSDARALRAVRNDKSPRSMRCEGSCRRGRAISISP